MNPDKFLMMVYVDAIVGCCHTTELNTDTMKSLEEYGWCDIIVSDAGTFMQWNMEFLSTRSLNDLMKIYNFCKTNKVHN